MMFAKSQIRCSRGRRYDVRQAVEGMLARLQGQGWRGRKENIREVVTGMLAKMQRGFARS